MMPARSQSSSHSGKASQPRLSGPIIDKYAVVPLVVCVLAVIVLPLMAFFNPYSREEISSGVARPETRICWPIMATISILFAVQSRSRLAKLTWPTHMRCLLAYLVFAGASLLWAFRPESSLARFIQEMMIVTSVVLPTMLAARTVDIMRGLFLCVALALCLNIPFVLSGTATIIDAGIGRGGHTKFLYIGCPGYFSEKNGLGECAAIGLLLSLREIYYRGWRRVFGVIGAVIAAYLVFVSNSKTAFGLAVIGPLLAGLVLTIRRKTGLSPAIILSSIPLFYIALSSVSHYNMNFLSYELYGDGSFTGRTWIWDFVQHEIDQRPLLGWGYKSFWLVPGSPADQAPGFVKKMPNGHSGYYDTTLELGRLGLAFLLVFVVATVHAIGRMADHDPVRAWLALSLALYVIVYNFLETLWMMGFNLEWLVFLIVAAEVGRYWQPLPLRRAAYRSRSLRPGSPGLSQGLQTPRCAVGRRDAHAPGICVGAVYKGAFCK
jgi:exopolysaccharide production protein ExoQ